MIERSTNDTAELFTTHDARAELAALETGATPEAALAFFDGLPPMPAEAMLGAWKGSGLPTGHPLDGMLEAYAWHGKRFDGPDDVHPLIMRGPRGLFSMHPSAMPLGLATRVAPLLKAPPVASIGRAVLGVFATRRPKARLRMSEYRGVVSATMVYDAIPVNDIFRAVDADTVLGAMDRRGDPSPYPFFFVLRRESP